MSQSLQARITQKNAITYTNLISEMKSIETEQYYQHTFGSRRITTTTSIINGKFLASVTRTKQVAKAVIYV